MGVTQDAGTFSRELLAWISKKFKITGNSYLVNRDFSKAFYQRFPQELDNISWSNPFDDKNLDFGFKILNLCYKNLLSGYNSESIALRIWALKVLLDLQKIIKMVLRNNHERTIN